MKLHNKYGYGQLFCFSGIDGETSRADDFVAMTLAEPITLRFHFIDTVTLKIPIGENAVFNAVTGDILDGDDFFVGFVDRNTIVGKSPVKPFVLTEGDHRSAQEGNTEKIFRYCSICAKNFFDKSKKNYLKSKCCCYAQFSFCY